MTTAWAIIRGRFIPACAGSRNRFSSKEGGATVHPRVRGEQAVGTAFAAPDRGSSPRARGAGHGTGLRLDIAAVHPRVRGEQVSGQRPEYDITGSSPRARGAVSLTRGMANDPRFIPACAGSRLIRTYSRVQTTVHPRVRGEQALPFCKAGIICGSSPRARGAGSTCAATVGRVRFIPACAGSRCAFLHIPRPVLVHPRVRGEQFDAALK